MPGVSPMEERPSALSEIAEQWFPLAMTVKRAYTVTNVRFGRFQTWLACFLSEMATARFGEEHAFPK